MLNAHFPGSTTIGTGADTQAPERIEAISTTRENWTSAKKVLMDIRTDSIADRATLGWSGDIGFLSPCMIPAMDRAPLSQETPRDACSQSTRYIIAFLLVKKVLMD
ncbi:hypothetical protein ACJJTC_009388 [Scirpophaga incertulas]